MHKATTVNRFFIDSFSFKRLGELQETISPREFYQQFVSGLTKGFSERESIGNLAERLAALAEYLYITRRINDLEQVSQLLLGLPLPTQYQNIGRYYKAFTIKRDGGISEALALFEQAADKATFQYKIKALMSIGATLCQRGDFKSAMSFWIEAGHALDHSRLSDPLALIQIERNIAVLKSIDGNHHGALANMENLLPLVRKIRRWHPHEFCNYLNSLAVELTEIGRLEEAEQACRIILASPFASAYPEWRETSNDIAVRGCRTSRSVVAFSQRTFELDNILRLPERNESLISADPSLDSSHQLASVLNFEDWKKKMVKEPNGTPPNEDPSKLDDREKLLRIIQLVSQPDRTGDELENILKSVEKIVAKKKDK